MKIQKKNGGGGVGSEGGLGGQDRCNRAVKFFYENSKKMWGGGGRCGGWRVRLGGEGLRVDVNEELKFL